MNEITIFEHPDFGSVRSVEVNNNPCFVGKDVALALGYSNPRDALAKHVDDEDKGVAKCDTPGGVQNLTVINESGVYALVFGSKLDKAKEFKHWVTSEVLPSIRKHGAYMTPETIEKVLTDPDFIIKLATNLKEEQEKNRRLQLENKSLKPKAAYFDKLVERELNLNFRDTAKELGVKQTDFMTFLKDNGFIYYTKKKEIRPYAEHVDDGLFVLKEFSTSTYDGTQTLLTPKGRLVIGKLMSAID